MQVQRSWDEKQEQNSVMEEIGYLKIIPVLIIKVKMHISAYYSYQIVSKFPFRVLYYYILYMYIYVCIITVIYEK